MQDKKVAIIVPIYNVAPFLNECLQSIKKQSYKNLFIILVNDGSTDESLEIALDFVLNEPRAVLIDKKNGGPSSARNAGLCLLLDEFKALTFRKISFKKALSKTNKTALSNETLSDKAPFVANLIFKEKSKMSEYLGEMRIYALQGDFTVPKCEFVGFVDSDDFIEPQSYELATNAIIQSKSDAVVWEAQIFGEVSSELLAELTAYYSVKHSGVCDELSDDLLYETDDSVSNKLWRLDIIKKANLRFINGRLNEDAPFFYCYFSLCKKGFFIDKRLYNYRQKSGTTMALFRSKKAKFNCDTLLNVKDIHDFWEKNGLLGRYWDFLHRIFASHYWATIRWNIQKFTPQINVIARELAIQMNLDKNHKLITTLLNDKPFFKKTKRKFGGENFGLFSHRITRVSSGKIALKGSYLMLFKKKIELFRVIETSKFRYFKAFKLKLCRLNKKQ